LDLEEVGSCGIEAPFVFSLPSLYEGTLVCRRLIARVESRERKDAKAERSGDDVIAERSKEWTHDGDGGQLEGKIALFPLWHRGLGLLPQSA